MIKVLNIFTAFLFPLMVLAQESTTINWLNTSSFEKEIKKKKQNIFIFISENGFNDKENISDEELQRTKRNMFGFLEDKSLVKYLNENFICYRFNPQIDNLKFLGKEYKKIEERGRSNHQFTSFLTKKDRNRLPTIVIMDKNFQLFEYKMTISKIEELKIVVEAEQLKFDYLKEKLAKDSRYLQEGNQMLKRQKNMLKRQEENKKRKSKSVFNGRKKPEQLINILKYFNSEAYKQIDLETYTKMK